MRGLEASAEFLEVMLKISQGSGAREGSNIQRGHGKGIHVFGAGCFKLEKARSGPGPVVKKFCSLGLRPGPFLERVLFLPFGRGLFN